MHHVPRRRFLRDSLAGAAALAAAVPQKGSASPNDQITVASVGVGGMGTAHVGRLIARSDVRIAAICDIDQSHRERAEQEVRRAKGYTPKSVEDFRELFDDKSIDALVIATPHHWHCPIAVPALIAGKDVYVEKPASHVFREGRLLIDAAKKYNRIVQHGTQMRSSAVIEQAGKLLKEGIIGDIKMSKAWNCQRHNHKQPVANSATPPGVNYDMWVGPAPKRDFNENRFHGNWSWYRDFGNGDIGNDGIHDLDMARWGLGVETHPNRITAHGSTIATTGEREYPDNMMVSYHYDEGKVLTYEDRAWSPYGNYGFDSGNAVYGTEGFMIYSRRGYFQVYLGRKEELGPGVRGGPTGHPEHMNNFLDCVRSRKQPIANAEVAHLSCGLTHLGEIAYRTGRVLDFDPAKEKFINDAEADKMLTKEYRAPWTIPDPV